jgi:hypothetical protein
MKVIKKGVYTLFITALVVSIGFIIMKFYESYQIREYGEDSVCIVFDNQEQGKAYCILFLKEGGHIIFKKNKKLYYVGTPYKVRYVPGKFKKNGQYIKVYWEDMIPVERKYYDVWDSLVAVDFKPF